MHSMKTAGLLKFLIRGLPVAVVLVVCPFVLPVYWTLILTEILIMGFFAMSFNLLLGYTGLLSFGQAGFFGVGAYGVGLMLTHGGESLFLALAARYVLRCRSRLWLSDTCVSGGMKFILP